MGNARVLALAEAAQDKAEFILWAPLVLSMTNTVPRELCCSGIGLGRNLRFGSAPVDAPLGFRDAGTNRSAFQL